MNGERPEHVQSHSRDLNTDGPDAEAQAGAFFRNQTAHRLHSQHEGCSAGRGTRLGPVLAPQNQAPPPRVFTRCLVTVHMLVQNHAKRLLLRETRRAQNGSEGRPALTFPL